MFDFEKLEVYSKAKCFNKSINQYINNHKLNSFQNDQLKRAAMSIILNIAEGTGRFTKPDKKNFYIIARGSAFECVAILDYLNDLNLIEEKAFKQYYRYLEEISKMLYALIKSLEK